MYSRVLFIIIALFLSFFLGYQLGVSENQLQTLKSQIAIWGAIRNEDSVGITLQPERVIDTSAESLQANDASKFDDDDLSTTQENISISNDIVDLFSQLFSLQHAGSDYKLYGRKIDEIRQRLSNNPTEIAIISEHFETLQMDSNESYLIVSILQGLPNKQGLEALTQLAVQSLDYSNEKGYQQFLEIVGRTGLTNEAITSGLKNIALYGEISEQRLNALDMLMPFQLTQSENQAVLEQLSQMQLNTEDQGQANFLFGQTLRFSDSKRRTELALNTLKDESSDIHRKSIILDFIELGQIDKSLATKETLFEIARSQGHPLQQNAVKVLVSSFDISQQDYQELLAFDEVELPILR